MPGYTFWGMTAKEWQEIYLSGNLTPNAGPRTHEGVLPFTEGPRGIAVTRAIAMFHCGFAGKVSTATVYKWLAQGQLPAIGYICTKKRRIAIFWSQDLAALVATMTPNQGKYRPGESGHYRRSPRTTSQARQFD